MELVKTLAGSPPRLSAGSGGGVIVCTLCTGNEQDLISGKSAIIDRKILDNRFVLLATAIAMG